MASRQLARRIQLPPFVAAGTSCTTVLQATVNATSLRPTIPRPQPRPAPCRVSRPRLYSTESSAPPSDAAAAGEGARTESRPSSGEANLIRVHDFKAPSSGYIRVLELNRPSTRNAISRDLLAALRKQVNDVARQYGSDTKVEVQSKVGQGPTRALIVASAVDEAFCAGADLKERATFTEEETREFLTNLRSTLAALESLPIPTISAIASPALGGGLELALATHFRVMASSAVVGLPETRLAIIPGAGGTYRLPGLIGVRKARDLILTGRRVGGPEAYAMGIADRLVDVVEHEEGEETSGGNAGATSAARAAARETVLVHAMDLAREICEGGPVAIRAALKALRWTKEEMENKMYEVVLGTQDRKEALRAFRKRESPVFEGK